MNIILVSVNQERSTALLKHGELFLMSYIGYYERAISLRVRRDVLIVLAANSIPAVTTVTVTGYYVNVPVKYYIARKFSRSCRFFSAATGTATTYY
jgi:hypothetical protein